MTRASEDDIVDGRIGDAEYFARMLARPAPPTFIRVVILETIPDPTLVDEKKAEYWKSILEISNWNQYKGLSRNSIVAQRIRTGETSINPPMFFLPFFPSHLALPCKVGEVVWAMFEHPSAREKELGFWFCKVATPHFVDDVNYTHFPGQLDETFTENTIKKSQNKNDAVYELRNGKTVSTRDGFRFVEIGSSYINSVGENLKKGTKTAEFAFESILQTREGARLTYYEPVPRFKKRPGDIALEGSNNTLIVLGTDRLGPIGESISLESNFGEKTLFPNIGEPYSNAGSIDLVAGRGTSKETAAKPAVYKSLMDGHDIFETSDKKNPFENEGNPDFISDRSRILLSQRTKVDNKFQIDDYLKRAGNISDSETGDAAVAIKSDKIRLIARSDISLVVTNFAADSKEGKMPHSSYEYKKDLPYKNSDFNEGWASITIKSNGDIVFTPGDYGVIKLGGDDADKAILCTSRPASIDEGDVTSKPIGTTAGGFVGAAFGNEDPEAKSLSAAPDLGTFSTKVVIK